METRFKITIGIKQGHTSQDTIVTYILLGTLFLKYQLIFLSL